MEKILNPPSANVSKDYILIEQKTVTQIKQAISRNATYKELEQIIKSGVLEMAKKDKNLARAMHKCLINSTNHWRFTYLTNMKMLNNSLYFQIVNYKQEGLQRVDNGDISAYNVNLNDILNEINGNPTKAIPIDQFRGFDTNARNGIPVIRNYQKMVQQQLKVLASEVPKVYEEGTDKNGNRKISLIPLRNKVEMAVRYQANLEDIASLKDDNVKLVWTSSHASCSPRCAEWQGRLFSLDGTSGTIDGIEYVPIEEALNANNGNSIINGYNCRHYLIEYKPGSKPPMHYTKQEMQKEYALDQQQRQFENTIRNYKANASVLMGTDPELAKKYEQEAKIKTLEYEAFSLKNDRAFYRWRCSIGEEL